MQEEIHQLEKLREIQLRTTAAMAAIEESAELIIKARKDNIPYSRGDNPSMVLRGLLMDLFDGCWDSGYSSGEDRSSTGEGK
jgi:hypothetical protein